MIKKEIRGKIREQTVGYILAAFGLVAGLAWNEAIKSLIETLFPFSKGTVFAKFFYAIFITAVFVFISQHILRVFGKNDSEKK